MESQTPTGLELSLLLLVLYFQLSSNGFNSQLVNAITKSDWISHRKRLRGRSVAKKVPTVKQ